MSDQNRFDEYKQKLLHWWNVFLTTCGKLWQSAKDKTGVALDYLRRNSRVLMQKLAAWTLKARQWLKKYWEIARKKGKKLLQKLAAWLLEVREKVKPMLLQGREWLASVIARVRRPKSDEPEALPPAAEAAALAEPEQTVEVPEQIEAAEPVEQTEETAPIEQVEEETVAEPAETKPWTTNPSLLKAGAVLAAVGGTMKLILKWIWRLRSVFMAIPVVWAAIKLAMQNMDRLPEKVGLDIQASGEFARMISRQEAVYWPLGITMFCLLLMFCSKKPLLPWVISVFTLVLPWLIWLLNYYA